MELFIPEALQKKTEQKMTRLVTKPGKNVLKMKVIASGVKELDTEWSIKVLFNHLDIPSEIIIIIKNN
jgi:hypothetical protein